MTTARNLSVEIRYKKLKVNFNYCFRYGIFQYQVFFFFVVFPGSFSNVVLLQDLFVLLLLVIRMFVKNSICTLQILEKQLHVFA